MTERGEQTRVSLLDAAEQLLGERGVGGVSLREIRIAAGSKMSGAIQFHFGDLEGLLMGLVARHLPRIGALQQEISESLRTDDPAAETRALVEVLVRPTADYLMLGASERQWVKIMADLGTQPDMRLVEMVAFAPRAALDAGNTLFARLRESIPTVIASERMVVAAQSTVHICADRARVLDNPRRSDHVISEHLFLQNLIDMTQGALTAPIGDPVAATIAAESTGRDPSGR